MALTVLLVSMIAAMLLEHSRESRNTDDRSADIVWRAHERIRPLGGFGAALILSQPPDLPPEHFVTPQQQTRIETLKAKLERKYSIRIRLFEVASIKQQFGLHAVPYKPSDIETHLTALGTWLKKYPPWYIAHCGLRTIYLLDQWQYGDVSAAGFLIGDNAIGITGSEEVLHHELWHIADASLSPPDDNERWLRAKFGNSPPGDTVSLSGISALQRNLHLQKRPFGYASAYGKYAGVDEDQATTAAMLLSDASDLALLMQKEPPLRAGVRYLQAFFADQSENRMNRTYWKDLVAGMTITDRYWKL
jgi:hypothetical protein